MPSAGVSDLPRDPSQARGVGPVLLLGEGADDQDRGGRERGGGLPRGVQVRLLRRVARGVRGAALGGDGGTAHPAGPEGDRGTDLAHGAVLQRAERLHAGGRRPAGPLLHRGGHRRRGDRRPPDRPRPVRGGADEVLPDPRACGTTAPSRTTDSSSGSREIPDREIRGKAGTGPLGRPRACRHRRPGRRDALRRRPRPVAPGRRRPVAPVVPGGRRRVAVPSLRGVPASPGERRRGSDRPPRHGDPDVPSRHPDRPAGGARGGPRGRDRRAPFEPERGDRRRRGDRRVGAGDARAGVHPLLQRLPCVLREIPPRRFTGRLPPSRRGGGVPRVPGDVPPAPDGGGALLPRRPPRRSGRGPFGDPRRRPVHRRAGAGRFLLRKHLLPGRGIRSSSPRPRRPSTNSPDASTRSRRTTGRRPGSPPPANCSPTAGSTRRPERAPSCTATRSSPSR